MSLQAVFAEVVKTIRDIIALNPLYRYVCHMIVTSRNIDCDKYFSVD